MERSRSARYFPRFERGWSPFSQASADAQESQDHYTWVGTRPPANFCKWAGVNRRGWLSLVIGLFRTHVAPA
jgi:hypothetical protein